MRIITVEEHFEHPEVSLRVLELAGPPPGMPLEDLAKFGSVFNDDRDAATRLGGHRLAHMDAVSTYRWSRTATARRVRCPGRSRSSCVAG